MNLLFNYGPGIYFLEGFIGNVFAIGAALLGYYISRRSHLIKTGDDTGGFTSYKIEDVLDVAGITSEHRYTFCERKFSLTDILVAVECQRFSPGGGQNTNFHYLEEFLWLFESPFTPNWYGSKNNESYKKYSVIRDHVVTDAEALNIFIHTGECNGKGSSNVLLANFGRAVVRQLPVNRGS